ncbi:MAG: hypothetical protein EOM87_04850, partial [Clostridia bacterium]|nr:hypothetical protein [Clostridia bacterium]
MFYNIVNLMLKENYFMGKFVETLRQKAKQLAEKIKQWIATFKKWELKKKIVAAAAVFLILALIVVLACIPLYIKNDVTAPQSYTINIDPTGELGLDPVIITDGIYTLPTDITREGHTFVGWYTTADFSGEPITFIEYTAGGNTSVYSNWSVNSYTISFDSNEGSAVASITEDYGAAIAAPDAPTKTENTFVGWYEDAEFTTAYTFATMPAGNITLYARWSTNQYTLSF